MPFNFENMKEYLVCPKSRCDLVRDADALVSTNPDQRLSYPIVDEIPRLMADESSELSVDVWSDIMKRHGRDPVSGKSIAPAAV